MVGLVLDTHSVIWLLHGDKRLSSTALQAINALSRERRQVAISSISLVEIAYLEEKERVPAGTLQGVLTLLDQPDTLIVEIPVTRHIIAALLEISCDEIPDMPDRVIAATALSLAVPLVSRDKSIQASQIRTI